MTDLIGAIVTAIAIIVGVAADLMIDNAPVIMFGLAALALAIGAIAMPLPNFDNKPEGGERGFR